MSEGVPQLQAAIGDCINALAVCRTEGISPADALEAVGIGMPPFAKPMMNMQLDSLIDAALGVVESDEERVAS